MPEFADVDEQYLLLSDKSSYMQLSSTVDYSARYPQFITYFYDTIARYYAYKVKRLANARVAERYNKDGETVDHGIFGGCQCYKEYCDFYIKYEYPHSCISADDDKHEIAAQHYIFRSLDV